MLIKKNFFLNRMQTTGQQKVKSVKLELLFLRIHDYLTNMQQCIINKQLCKKYIYIYGEYKNIKTNSC